MNVGKRIRHLKRYREIVSAFVRYGFGFIVKDLGLAQGLSYKAIWDEERRDLQKHSIGLRIRLFLEEMGPTFVKLGQLASTRADLLPAEVIAELARLQDDVPAFPFSEARTILEKELGSSVEELFLEIQETPIAAASIGQVHYAVLKDGTDVAVKVQRPSVRSRIETDLEILGELSRLAEKRLDWARRYRVSEMMEELGSALRNELNYGREASNAEKFAVFSAELPYVRIPRVFRELSSGKVLTMEFIDGIRLNEREKLEREGISRAQVAERFTTAMLQQILIEGFFHADPHPGNVLVLPGGELAFLDFGMVGRLSSEAKTHFATFVIALRNQSTDGIIAAIERLGLIPDDADRASLRSDVDELREDYYQVPLSQISIADAVKKLMSLAYRHRIRIPADLTLLGKSLMTMEGVVSGLDSDFSIMDAAEPFGRRLVTDRLNPFSILKIWARHLPEYADLLTEAPGKLRELLTLAKQGKIKLELSVPEKQMNRMLKKLDRVGNRLAFSIVLLAFSIMMAGLIVGSSMGHEYMLPWKVPAVVVGFIVAALMFVWLIYSIFRSGRF
ncbi:MULTISPECIES: ABC1 kinase family protein [Cohnella]|uniref:ABC1 kinase family protein n=1 Tax=Cohnella TaxID=329857 RepID=UPI0009BA803F|nr:MULTISPECIES: AarF/ABC1/UbiB kinase family protein [Cohnella]MBN2980014.1 AarF/ABC1/UbiB kinase family protein [Cohnella algarum]